MTDMDLVEKRYLTVWWPRTRRFMIYRIMHRAGPLLDLVRNVHEVDKELSDRIEVEFRHVLAEAFGRDPDRMTRRQRAIWKAAIGVWPKVCELVQLIKMDRAVRGLSTVAPAPALGQLLKRHLDACRREVLDHTEYEERIWRKLLGISRDLINEYQTTHETPPWHGYLCSSEHFKQIRAHILRHMEDDELIARIKLSTIEYYFGRFCDECRDFVSDDVSDTLVGDQPWENNAENLLLLKACIEKLDKSLRDVIDAEFFPDDKVVQIKPDHLGIGSRGGMQSDGEFERLRREALRQLRICFGERK